MVKVQDFLNRIKAKKEIGNSNYNKIRQYVKHSFADTYDSALKRGVTYPKMLLENAHQLRSNIAMHDVLTTFSSVVTGACVYSCFTEEDIIKYMLAGSLGLVGITMSAIRGASYRRAYKHNRNRLVDYIYEKVEDHHKDAPTVRNVNELDEISLQNPTILGQEMSKETMNTVITDACQDLIDCK